MVKADLKLGIIMVVGAAATGVAGDGRGGGVAAAVMTAVMVIWLQL